MRNRMTAYLVTLLLVPALALGALFPPVKGDICATIPFDFIVGDKVLPSGNYIVRIDSTSGLVEICEDGIYCESVVTSPIEMPQAPEKPELAFRKYGNQYFLAQVWATGRIGRHLPASSLHPNINEAIRTWEAVYVEARTMCIHQNAEFNLAPTWH